MLNAAANREQIGNVTQALMATLSVSLKANKIDPNDMSLHELFLVLASFNGLILKSAYESASLSKEKQSQFTKEYCDALAHALENTPYG